MLIYLKITGSHSSEKKRCFHFGDEVSKGEMRLVGAHRIIIYHTINASIANLPSLILASFILNSRIIYIEVTLGLLCGISGRFC